MENTYLERLNQEQTELEEKIEKLGKMLSVITEITFISDEEKKLMRAQYVTMQEYNQILVQRMKLNHQ